MGRKIVALCFMLNMLFCIGYASEISQEAYPNTSIQPGSIVRLGKYEQDDNNENGPEQIEWLVLAVEDDRALLITRYALEGIARLQDGYLEWEKEYAGTQERWENNFWRMWLNDSFWQQSFSHDEQEIIMLTRVTADENPHYHVDPGQDTWDRIFFLSIDEAKRYFADDAARITAATEHGYQKEWIVGMKGNVTWWLRTPGADRSKIATVHTSGYINEVGQDKLDTGSARIRPAMWVKVSLLEPMLPFTAELVSESPGFSLQNEETYCKRGDRFVFGRYEQDNDLTNGFEPIEWIVYDMNETHISLTSVYGLDTMPFHTSEEITWENSNIRQWLNTEFLTAAFTAKEVSVLQFCDTSMEQLAWFYDLSDPGGYTEDRVYLLSTSEAIEIDTNELQLQPTAYAIVRGAQIYTEHKHENDEYALYSEDIFGCCWWLRNTGRTQREAAIVLQDGSIHHYGVDMSCADIMVRPCITIDLQAWMKLEP